jgi:sirohydrochlorin cobaltochelatase
MKSALILFGHGAREPRWAEPFQRLQRLLQAQMPDKEVSLAFLELMSPRLPELIGDLVNRGYDSVTVVPVFFGQGGHVLRDLPVMIEQLRKQYPMLSLTVAKAVGEDDAVLNAIAQYCIAAANPR